MSRARNEPMGSRLKFTPAKLGLRGILKIFTDGDRLGCSDMRTAAAVEQPAARHHQDGVWICRRMTLKVTQVCWCFRTSSCPTPSSPSTSAPRSGLSQPPHSRGELTVARRMIGEMLTPRGREAALNSTEVHQVSVIKYYQWRKYEAVFRREQVIMSCLLAM